MTEGYFKDLRRITGSDKISCEQVFNIAKNLFKKSRSLPIKKSSFNGLKTFLMKSLELLLTEDQELFLIQFLLTNNHQNRLHKPVIRILK